MKEVKEKVVWGWVRRREKEEGEKLWGREREHTATTMWHSIFTLNEARYAVNERIALSFIAARCS